MRHIPDDIRFMPHEVRIAEGHMVAPERKRVEKPVTTCWCGKTVVATFGRPTGVTCPRECDEARKAEVAARRERV